MKLQCLNGIITKDLVIDIDLSNINSWNLNSNFTATSLVNYKDRITSDLDLVDFGLTGFDNGRTNRLNDNITLSTNDKFTLYRIGYNNVINPSSGQTSGYTSNINYNIFPISGITTGLTGNYFELKGGYLQGFFKLNDFNIELFPSRYNNGITIETLLNININTEGIFYLMGLRAEDKYNPSFSGETILTSSTKKIFGNNTGTIYNTGATSNIKTSFGNILAAIDPTITPNDVFKDFSDSRTVIDVIPNQIDNLKNNIIAFEITSDKRLGYRYINSNGLFESNISTNKLNNLGWNIIDIVFQPYTMIDNFDETIQNCYDLRKGKLLFYVNGRKFWEVKNFEEFYFRGLDNNKEKQIGVPYNISWGGGSFGLKYSYHYDYHNYNIYNTNNDLNYINSKYHVEYDPNISSCTFTGDTKQYQSGLLLSANTTSFIDYDKCNNPTPLNVLDISYSGNTTGQTNSDYFIKFNQPIIVRPNIEYDISLLINDTGIFNNNGFDNEISILISGDTINNIEIIENHKYLNNPSDPTHNPSIIVLNQAPGFYDDHEENEYINNGVIIDVITGYPVIKGPGLVNKGVDYNESPVFAFDQPSLTGIWKTITYKFRINDYNNEKFKFYFGFIIKSSKNLISNKHLYIKEFKYIANDILVKDSIKNNLTIENKFNNSFIGGIQKLKVYDNALESNEILNNTYWEGISNKNYNLLINEGGRIINN